MTEEQYEKMIIEVSNKLKENKIDVNKYIRDFCQYHAFSQSCALLKKNVDKL